MPPRHDIADMYPLKSAIEDLLGNRAWLDLKESTSVTTWRRYALKLMDAIELAVETTILIRDDRWAEDVRSNLAHGRELARIADTVDDVVAALSATLLRQVFLQLGHSPARKTAASVPLKPQHWNLSGFRSVQIVQTPNQREDLFRSDQRRRIGFDAQFDLEAEYRRSGSKIAYSHWCEEREAKHTVSGEGRR